MKKLLFAVFLCVYGFVKSQNFALYYSFSSVTATSGTVDPTPPPTAPGMSAGSFSAIGLFANPTTTNVFAFQGWGTGATNGDDVNFAGSVDLNKKFEVSLSPQSGYKFNIDSIFFYMNRSGTGPRMWVLRSSVSNYSVNLPAASVSSHTNIQINSGNVFFWASDSYTTFTWNNRCVSRTYSLSEHQNIASTAYYSFHAYNAESANGSFRIDSVVFNGSASLVGGLKTFTHKLNSGFYLYPNPVGHDGCITLVSEIPFIRWEIIGADGKIYANGTVDETQVKCNLNNLPTGVYFVRITGKQGVRTEKLLVQ
jgi:hypothetical protein